jgi:hypothetical protein
MGSNQTTGFNGVGIGTGSVMESGDVTNTLRNPFRPDTGKNVFASGIHRKMG